MYSGRIEGMGGIFRSSAPMPAHNYSNLLQDLVTTSIGGLHGNAVELRGEGPLYLIGGTYRANVAVGMKSLVYVLGPRFEPDKGPKSALLPSDFSAPLDPRIQRTGETRVLPHLRGKAQVVRVEQTAAPGIRQLPGTSGARIHQVLQQARLTLDVAAGQAMLDIKLPASARQPDGDYHVSVTPNFNAGAVWVEHKASDSLMVRFANRAGDGAKLDLLLTRGG